LGNRVHNGGSCHEWREEMRGGSLTGESGGFRSFRTALLNIRIVIIYVRNVLLSDFNFLNFGFGVVGFNSMTPDRKDNAYNKNHEQSSKYRNSRPKVLTDDQDRDKDTKRQHRINAGPDE